MAKAWNLSHLCTFTKEQAAGFSNRQIATKASRPHERIAKSNG